uniref:C2H2-type domain-containing protein n=1 Tax=Stomoxys calcitrans TaxID=35570 RepID=A0A1I8P194_STOCA
MVLDEKKIPQEIVKIFCDDVQNQCVNLCSDDEAEDNATSSSKDTTIKTGDQESLKTGGVNENNRVFKERDTVMSKDNIDSSRDTLNNISVDLLRRIEQVSSKNDKTNDTPQNSHSPNNKNIQISNKTISPKKARNEKRRLSYNPIVIDTISLDSDDEESGAIIANKTKDKNNKNTHGSITLTTDQRRSVNSASRLNIVSNDQRIKQQKISPNNNQNTKSAEKTLNAHNKRKKSNEWQETENSTPNDDGSKRQKFSENSAFRAKNDDIRSILLTTLQPYEGKIASMWESHKKPQETPKTDHRPTQTQNGQNNTNTASSGVTNDKACNNNNGMEDGRTSTPCCIINEKNNESLEEGSTSNLSTEVQTSPNQFSTEFSLRMEKAKSDSYNQDDEQSEIQMPKRLTKRRSSVHARAIIAKMLCSQSSTEPNENRLASKEFRVESQDSLVGSDFAEEMEQNRNATSIGNETTKKNPQVENPELGIGPQELINESGDSSHMEHNAKLQTKTDKFSRALKELEISFKGYDQQEILMPKSIAKRRSSVHARVVIAEMLCSQPRPESNDRQTSSGTSSTTNVEQFKPQTPQDSLDGSDFEYDPAQELEENNSNANQKSEVKSTSYLCDTSKSTNNANKKTKIDKFTRMMKELEISFKGYEQQEILMPPAISKRRSSVHARTVIAEMLCSQESADRNLDNKRQSSKQARNAISEQLKTQIEDSLDGSVFSSDPSTPLSFSLNSEQENSMDSLYVNYSELTNNQLSSRPSNTYTSNFTSHGDSDSESDSYDFEKFRLAKMKKRIIENQPQVVLVRLTEDEIRKLSKPVDILNVHLVKSEILPHTAVESMSRTKSVDCRKLRHKTPNNDPTMTCNNTTFCALCTSRPSDLTNHYVRMHKSESYVSRLSSSRLDELAANIPFAKEVATMEGRGGKPRFVRYAVTCPFCEDELVEPFMNLYNHYASHTGEYAFQCSGCKLAKPYKADIQSHQLNARTCRNSKLQVMYCYSPKTMTIHLHYCIICNFAQLNEANIIKHLREHHDQRQATVSNVGKCILAAISDGQEERSGSVCSVQDKNEEIACNTKNTETELCPPLVEDDDIPVRNEACMDESFDSKPMHEEATAIVPKTNTKCAITPPRPRPTAIEICDNLLITPPRPSLQRLQTNNPLWSTRSTYRLYPENVRYLGLYKCMVEDCYYSSDAPNEMLHHLESHGKEIVANEYLQCAYCMVTEASINSPQQLIDHVKQHHQHMIYQCSACAYRSCEASNVIIHQKECHSTAVESSIAGKVFKCPGTERPSKAGYLKEKISQNVQKMPCPYCSIKSFYHTYLLEQHVLADHKPHVMPSKASKKYSCIYCTLMDSDQGVIRKHVALKHPEEMPYFCSHNNPVAVNQDLHQNLQSLALTQPVSCIEVEATLDSTAKTPDDNELVNQEVKPHTEELIKCQEETIRIRLQKFTDITGVAPDNLYRCPEPSCGGFFSIYDLWLRHMRTKHLCMQCQCPHCPQGKTFSLTDYKLHFEEHRRHTFICFHCPATFRYHQEAVDHAARGAHVVPMRLERIRFNISYSYFVIIKKDTLAERSEFIPEFLNALNNRLKELHSKEMANFKRLWPITIQTSPWLEDYEKIITRKLKKKCFNSNCSFRATENEDIYRHVRENHNVSGTSFSCSHCDFHLAPCRQWDDVLNHVEQHSNYGLFICLSCVSIHHTRSKLSNHIRSDHAARDVAVINLIKKKKHTHVGLSVVLANECLSFSTMRNCFCCEERGMKGDAFIAHLKRYHKFVLTYYCDWCNLPIESLHLANEHYKKIHTRNKLKLRVELSSKHDITISSINDLQVYLVGEQEQPRVKTEVDPTNDDSIIILDDDDVVAEHEVRDREQEENKAKKPTLKCIAMNNLLKPGHSTENPLLVKNGDQNRQNNAKKPQLNCIAMTKLLKPSSSSDESNSQNVLPHVRVVPLPKNVIQRPLSFGSIPLENGQNSQQKVVAINILPPAKKTHRAVQLPIVVNGVSSTANVAVPFTPTSKHCAQTSSPTPGHLAQNTNAHTNSSSMHRTKNSAPNIAGQQSRHSPANSSGSHKHSNTFNQHTYAANENNVSSGVPKDAATSNNSQIPGTPTMNGQIGHAQAPSTLHTPVNGAIIQNIQILGATSIYNSPIATAPTSSVSHYQNPNLSQYPNQSAAMNHQPHYPATSSYGSQNPSNTPYTLPITTVANYPSQYSQAPAYRYGNYRSLPQYSTSAPPYQMANTAQQQIPTALPAKYVQNHLGPSTTISGTSNNTYNTVAYSSSIGPTRRYQMPPTTNTSTNANGIYTYYPHSIEAVSTHSYQQQIQTPSVWPTDSYNTNATAYDNHSHQNSALAPVQNTNYSPYNTARTLIESHISNHPHISQNGWPKESTLTNEYTTGYNNNGNNMQARLHAPLSTPQEYPATCVNVTNNQTRRQAQQENANGMPISSESPSCIQTISTQQTANHRSWTGQSTTATHARSSYPEGSNVSVRPIATVTATPKLSDT